jgi:hypothetical protein
MSGVGATRGAKISASLAVFLLFASLFLAFALPALGIQLFQAYRNREWAKCGMSQYEIDEWRRVGISDPGEAVKWRNGSFQAPHASLWREAGFGPIEAAGWMKGDFHPGEAKIWSREGFNAETATAWKAQKFYYPEAQEWQQAGVPPAEAAARAKRGETP